MSKKRLIPKLLLKKSRTNPAKRVLVTTVNFDRIIDIGDPVSQAKIFEAQSADELLIIDLDAMKEGRATSLGVVRHMAEQIFMPFTVGGGVRTLGDIRSLLSNGADKVLINTAALSDAEFVQRASDRFGSSTVVVGIDFRNENGVAIVYAESGRRRTDKGLMSWALECERRGAGELLLTSIDRDGLRTGLDLDPIRQVATGVGIPVIASGGCGVTEHIVNGFISGGVSAVSAGTFFCFKDENFIQARATIKNAGVAIRSMA